MHQRELTRGFQQLESHYLFDHHFCTIRRGNEKGVVEGGVKYARLNFMVPVPQVGNLEELNEQVGGEMPRGLGTQIAGQERHQGTAS